MADAGVLRVEDGDISFRQPYTYCYFVAWHLAQRLNANDAAAREEVKRLCKDLYHEDTANVLVFLAHLTTSAVVVEEMIGRAAELFATSKETDLASDVEPINNLYQKAQGLVLPPGDAEQHKLDLKDKQDEHKAERDGKTNPRREVKLKPPPPDRATRDANFSKIMELVTSMRTIEILGQVLRNEATARKVPELLAITKQVFSVGRRMLGFLFSVNAEHLERTISNLEEQYRNRMPEAKPEDLTDEASRHVFNMYTFAAFAVLKHVAQAVSERNLLEVIRQLVDGDPNLAHRICKLSIDLDTASKLPLRDVEKLNDELSGKTQGPDNKRTYNNLAHTVVRALVVDYMYLNQVPRPQIQALCQKLHIQVPAGVVDQTVKRLPPK